MILATLTIWISSHLPWGPVLVLVFGFLPGALLGARDVGLFPSLVGIFIAAVFSAAALFAGPLWSLPLAAASLLALHMLNVVKIGDLVAVARSIKL